MTVLKIKKLEESFGESKREYTELGVKTEMEKGGQEKHLWGKNLSLSLIDTIKYCQNIDDFFVPSVALLTKICINCLQNKANSHADKIIQDFDNYWHRTMSIIVFPTENNNGYIVHYPHIDGDDLKRDQGVIKGDFVVNLENNEIPPFGEIAYLNEYPDFFDKLLGKSTAKVLVSEVKKNYNFIPSVWIPPEISINANPERLVLFGGLLQYGQGLWLTSNSPDKTIVGTRPFKGVYKMK